MLGRFQFLLISAIAATLCGYTATAQAQVRQAVYAQPDYDVVYVRCPRGTEPVTVNGGEHTFSNWNGVNDQWLSVLNNTYQQPGCDLVLHHSDPAYGGGLPQGDPGREQVLVACNESDTTQPVCSVVDPNVSFDGRYVVYTKFTDTRQVITASGITDVAATTSHQSFMNLFPDGSGPNGSFASRVPVELKAFDAPALIYMYDLQLGTERQVSPNAQFFAGRAYPGKGTEWSGNIPVMDTSPFFLPNGDIGFTSNRASGWDLFQLFRMDRNGRNLQLIGHRAMENQLHPAILKDGRIVYTSRDTMLQKGTSNNASLFTVDPDGGDPFIFAGKHDATLHSYHYVTQLSDGDIVSAVYYNGNNTGLGTLLRFPVDPPGADFEHLWGSLDNARPFTPGDAWMWGNQLMPFSRVGQFLLTPQATSGDVQERLYATTDQQWIHPSRTPGGRSVTIGTRQFSLDNDLITVKGKFSHPAAAPGNDLLTAYTIGGSSTMPDDTFKQSLDATLALIGKDAGVWLIPLEAGSPRQLGNIADDGQIVVDFPQYHEIMPRAVVSYDRIYGAPHPVIKPARKNSGGVDPRLAAGEPFGLSGAASMFDRETRSLNGTPWNMHDGGGFMSGRTYMNLAVNGAELAIFDNSEIYGIRVSLPMPHHPIGTWNNIEQWAGAQKHHLRILGEFPVRKPDGTPLDGQGNPDTSFIVKLPADTPFLFQTIDKRGMALDIETASRTVARGEQQLCTGCHVHTREGLDPFQSSAKYDTTAPYADFSGASAPLFSGIGTDGKPIVADANQIYSETLAPGVNARRSFAVDWENGVKQVIQSRCASCHGEGQPAQQLTGLLLDGTVQTYELLTKNQYTPAAGGAVINAATKPGDGLLDVLNGTAGTDRITPHFSCCTPSRWMSLNSARSSMLVWALYGERLDGRDPQTGLPYVGSGVPVDPQGRDIPEIWPKVAEHGQYPEIVNMPEAEKRLITRWIDIGAPKLNIHDDLIRPVLTLTPLLEGGAVSRVNVGMWDDSALNYASFNVTRNGVDITPTITGTPTVITVDLGMSVTETNADTVEFAFEIWDSPDRSLSLVSPATSAANRTRKVLTGRGLLEMAGAVSNAAPTAASAVIDTDTATPGYAYPSVTDPDQGDVHFFTIVSLPANGSAYIENNRLVYVANPNFTGSDSFQFRATDLGGLSVVGTASVTVRAPVNSAPTSASALIDTQVNTTASVVPNVVDPDAGDTHTFTIISNPAHGTASVQSNQLVYVPNTDYVGSDSFGFRATDSAGNFVDGVADVTVRAITQLSSSTNVKVDSKNKLTDTATTQINVGALGLLETLFLTGIGAIFLLRRGRKRSLH